MKLKVSTLTSLVAGALFATSVAAETELTVYTAVEAEDLARYAETFNATWLCGYSELCASRPVGGLAGILDIFEILEFPDFWDFEIRRPLRAPRL